MALGNINVSNTTKIEEEINNIVSDKWNNSVTYNVGEYCIYKDTLWKCLLQNNGQTPEEGTYWTKVNIGSEIKSVNTKIGNTDISSIGDGTTTGAVNTINSNLEVVTDTTTVNLLKPYNRTSYNGITYTLNNDGSIHASGTLSNSGQTRCLLPPMTFSSTCKFGYSIKYNESSVQGDWCGWCDGLSTNFWNGRVFSVGQSTGNWFMYTSGSAGDVIDLDIYLWLEPGTKLHSFVPYTGNTGKLNSDVGTLMSILDSLTYPNAGAHNSIYRGKNLGTSYTAEQKAQIQAGTFNDLYIGDYWVINGVTWRIAHFDYWLNTGDTECTTHHAVIVPDTCLCNAKMNDTNTTVGAYVGSKMNLENMTTAITIIRNAFGSGNFLLHRTYLANATTSESDPTYESLGSWYDSTVELMNECMVYGSNILHNVEVNGKVPTNYTIDKSQLALFRIDPSKICNRTNWWLRDVVSASDFARVNSYGNATNYEASSSHGVRPAFGIC